MKIFPRRQQQKFLENFLEKIIFAVQKLFLSNFCSTKITFSIFYKSRRNAICKIFGFKTCRNQFLQNIFSKKFLKTFQKFFLQFRLKNLQKLSQKNLFLKLRLKNLQKKILDRSRENF